MSLTRSRPPPSVHSSWVSPTSQSSASSMSQRSHSSPSLSPDFDYFAQNVLDPSFQRYASPSATPNPNTPGGGFHPYRRPTTLTKSRSSHAARASSPLVSTSLSRNPSPALPLPSKRPSTAPRPQVQERTRSNSSGSSQGSSSTPTASPVARGLSPQFEALRRLRRVPVVSDPASTPSTPVTEAATTAPPSEHTPDVSTSLSPPPSSPPTDPPKRPSRMAIFSKSKSEGKAADTISLSSTMSSASLMIRKLGKLGSKLPAMKGMRRESLSGISSIFSKTKKHAKSETLEPSVSYATVELDRTNDLKVDPDGLTPAARLAQEHLAKSQPIEIQLPPESVSSPRDSSYEPTILIQQPSPDVTENLKTNDTVAPVLSAVDDGRSQAYEDALIEAWSSLHLSPTPKPLTKGILKNRNGSSEQPSNVLAHSGQS
ncbi:hypothetical protein DL96DRAFT_870176 [Flagelloscypha sp. PMI_526]|nr:hypothetical protein DL96DRAFT_870176 [Flagelloscypha sp. PMI_526]